MSYGWPGNVRELENLMERLIVLKKDELIDVKDLPAKVAGSTAALAPGVAAEGGDFDIPEAGISFKKAVDDFESKLIVGALRRTGGNKNKAASLLNLNRTTLVEKIKKKGLSAQEVE
jgi:DNA-binding NtrC family response regulator